MALTRSIFLLALCPAILHSQDSVVVLSPLVGSVIDSAEAARYDVLRSFPRLREATFISQGEGRYKARIVQETATGVRETTFTVTSVSLRNIHARIHHRAELEAGTYYAPGDQCPIARVAQKEIWAGSDRLQFTSWSEPRFDKGPPLDVVYPRLHFGFGLTQLAPTVSGMEEAVRWVEDYYRSRGYAISPLAKEPSLSPLIFLFDLGLAFSSEIGLTIESGQTSQGGGEGNSAKMWFAAASLLYTPDLLRIGFVRFGAGISCYRWAQEMTVKYSYGQVVSPIDPGGGFYRLESIQFRMGDQRWGGSLLLIGEALLDGLPLLSAYVRFTPSSTMTVPVPEGVPDQEITITLERVSAGLRVNIHL